jgi:hypothetical protein
MKVQYASLISDASYVITLMLYLAYFHTVIMGYGQCLPSLATAQIGY